MGVWVCVCVCGCVCVCVCVCLRVLLLSHNRLLVGFLGFFLLLLLLPLSLFALKEELVDKLLEENTAARRFCDCVWARVWWRVTVSAKRAQVCGCECEWACVIVA